MALLFFDIDGTLWDIHQYIPESTKEAIRLLHENGHESFLCSGRTKSFIKADELLALNFDGLMCGCGTQILYHGEELLYKKLEREQIRRAVDIFYQYEMPVILEGKHKLYMDREMICKDPYGEHLFAANSDIIEPLFYNDENWEGSKYSVVIEGTDFPTVIDMLKDEYDFMVHGTHVMEVAPLGFSKATALAFMEKKLGVPREDIYAFGDSANDISMLDYAGKGVVMGNGSDDAKEHADYVTSPLHEDGIFNACRHFGLI